MDYIQEWFDTKVCIKCNIRKPNNEFSPIKKYNSSYCKQCCREYQRQYYQNSQKIVFICQCGTSVNGKSIKNHFKSKRHSRFVEFLASKKINSNPPLI